MGIFRSEEILHKKIRIPTESALETMDALGKLAKGAIEFIDLNKNDLEAKKVFANMTKRCEEIDRKLSNFELFAQEFKQTLYKYTDYNHFLHDLTKDMDRRHRHEGNYFDIIEYEIIEEEKRLIELIDSYTKIKENLEILIEKKFVLDKSNQLVNMNADLANYNASPSSSGMIIEDGNQPTGLNFIAGVSKAEDEIRMKRMIFRASKGRAIMTFFDFYNYDLININIQDSQIKLTKKIFTIFYHGGIGHFLLNKILRICDLFGVSRYNIPKREEIRNIIINLQSEITEKKTFLKEAENSIKNYLKNKLGAENKPGLLELFRLYFKKEKMIYTNLTKCICRDNFIDGEVWILKNEYNTVKEALKDLDKEGVRMPTTFTNVEHLSPNKPTHINTNEFLYPFQEIVNTYGIPAYQEINPAYFNIVTFPFLFGIMFGDIGHGLILFTFGIYLCSTAESRNNQSVLKPLNQVRYLLLLMGFFALFCGFIYNEFFSLPLPLFGTCYQDSSNSTDSTAYAPDRIDNSCVYPFGFDPVWRISKNELTFTNSYKMKISVIIGVLHMIFGLMLKGMNEIYFDRKIQFIFEFIPQLFFMIGLFGYMIVLIFIKWSTDWSGETQYAPSLISQMMNIFLSFGSVNDKPLWEEKIENGRYFQENLHIIILLVCVVLIPIMLIPKPIILYFQHRNMLRNRNLGFGKLSDDHRIIGDNSYLSSQQEFHEPESHEAHTFGELFVHSAIETIEFVLGTISNTASYLRLWALSLAHGQLSKVFIEKTILNPISDGDIFPGIIKVY